MAGESDVDEAKPVANRTSVRESPRLRSNPARRAVGVDQFGTGSSSYLHDKGPREGAAENLSSQAKMNFKLEAVLRQRGSIAKLFEAYEQAKSSGVSPNQRTLFLLLVGCAWRQDLDRAMEFVRECESQGVVLTTLHVNQLLKAAAFAPIQRVCEIAGLFESQRLIPNAMSYDCIFLACFRNPNQNTALRLATAVDFYHRMKRSQLDLSANQKRDFIRLLVASDSEQHAALATQLLASLEPRTPDEKGQPEPLQESELEAHDAVLYMTWRAGDMASFEHVYDLSKRRGLRLDHGCYTILLNHAARLGDVPKAEEVWDDLSAVFPEPSRAAYHALLHTYVQAKNLPKAFATLQAMDAASVPCPPSLISLLADACGSTPQELDKAYYVLLDLKDAGRPISIHALNAVIQGCSSIGDLNRAYETFDEADKTFGLQPNTATYNALLAGYVKVRNHAGLRKLYAAMESANVKPDDATNKLLLISYCNTSQLELALAHFRLIGRPSIEDYTSTIYRIIQSPKHRHLVPAALDLLVAMRKDGFPVPGFLRRAILLANLGPEWDQVLSPRNNAATTSSANRTATHTDHRDATHAAPLPAGPPESVEETHDSIGQAHEEPKAEVGSQAQDASETHVP